MSSRARAVKHSLMLEKVSTGIQGLDEITNGGFPRGRTVLVTGGPGTGKSMMAMEFLARGASLFGEPGVFVSFEENIEEMITNEASLGFDIQKLARQASFPWIMCQWSGLRSKNPASTTSMACSSGSTTHHTDRRQKGGPEHHRVALCRACQQRHPPGRAAQTLPLAQGQGRYELAVIDIYQQPGAAGDQGITDPPTLVKEKQLPMRRLIGDLSNLEHVLSGLSLVPMAGSFL